MAYLRLRRSRFRSNLLADRFGNALHAAIAVDARQHGVAGRQKLAAAEEGIVVLELGLADAVDFFGDAANYGISLLVLGMALTWRARAALFKGLTMGAFGVFVLGRAAWSAAAGTVPEPVTMGAIGALALLANVSVAVMLYAWREGDANMRSVWLCSRNDAIGNVAVMFAALGVLGTGSGWPDFAVAAALGLLALFSAHTIINTAMHELRYPGNTGKPA